MIKCTQVRANLELELRTANTRLEQEVAAHKETQAKLNDEKQSAFKRKDEANMTAVKGEHFFCL
jgi:uncharacterized protein YdaU (DUF1376 family)